MLRTHAAGLPGDGFTLATTADVLTGTRTTGRCRLDARVNIRYRVADPFAVTLDIADGDGWARWTLDRDLLVKGMTTATGLGDVQVYPVGDRQIRIDLSCPDGEAKLIFSRPVVEQAVAAIEHMVPAGTEWDRIDFDTALATGLGGDAR
jgi:hypothetical protein